MKITINKFSLVRRASHDFYMFCNHFLLLNLRCSMGYTYVMGAGSNLLVEPGQGKKRIYIYTKKYHIACADVNSSDKILRFPVIYANSKNSGFVNFLWSGLKTGPFRGPLLLKLIMMMTQHHIKNSEAVPPVINCTITFYAVLIILFYNSA